MAKTVVLLRHGAYTPVQGADPNSWQREANLSPEGRADLERMRTRWQGVDFSFLAHSPLPRAKQTALVVRPEANWQELAGLGPRMLEVWNTLVRHFDNQPADVSLAILQRWPGFLEAEGDWIVRTIMDEVLTQMEPGSSALLVSHQPLIELAHNAMFFGHPGHVFPDFTELKKGEAYEITFEDEGGRPRECHHLTIPD